MKQLCLKILQIFTIIGLSFGGSIMHAQIVNVEAERIQTGASGWAGSAKLGMHASKDVEGSMLLQTEAHVQLKLDDHLFLLKGSTYFSKSGSETFSENSFLHFRHNYKVFDWLRWEAYTQAQKNQIAGIEFRGLIGTGPRFKIMKDSSLAVYAAVSYMFEHQNEQYPLIGIVHKNDHRLSSYISYTFKPSDGIAFVHTAYYQPLLKAPGDYRISSDLSVSFAVTKILGFTLSYQALYDSDPVPGKPRFTYVLEDQLQISFGGK